MNWGYKIALVYILFAAGILTLVFKAKSEKVELVSQDYYAQEVAYQKKLDALNNASALSSRVEVIQTEEGIEIRLPKECASLTDGSIALYRPSDSSLDKTVALSLDSDAVQTISRKELNSGLYTFKVEWNFAGKTCYAENALIVQP
jgi:hypothetical protein